jgi:predicted DNA-binding WGR domain protein
MNDYENEHKFFAAELKESEVSLRAARRGNPGTQLSALVVANAAA